jgi:hypothetical protein
MIDMKIERDFKFFGKDYEDREQLLAKINR